MKPHKQKRSLNIHMLTWKMDASRGDGVTERRSSDGQISV